MEAHGAWFRVSCAARGFMRGFLLGPREVHEGNGRGIGQTSKGDINRETAESASSKIHTPMVIAVSPLSLQLDPASSKIHTPMFFSID